jgi:GntR family transcriptional regulator/MocR family aminotransferase
VLASVRAEPLRFGRPQWTREVDHVPPFRTGVPALDEFPTTLWSRLLARRWRRGRVPLWNGESAGHPLLRHAVRTYLASTRGVECEPEQVIIVNGSQQALDLASRLLLDPGDQVWMEDRGTRVHAPH